jgi:hypothetical protein
MLHRICLATFCLGQVYNLAMAASDDDSQQSKDESSQEIDLTTEKKHTSKSSRSILDRFQSLSRIAEPDILRQIRELREFTTIPALETVKGLKQLYDFPKPIAFEMPSALSSIVEAQEALDSDNLRDLIASLNSHQSNLLNELNSTFYARQSSLLGSVHDDLLETARNLSASNIFNDSALSLATETMNLLDNNVLWMRESILEHSKITNQFWNDLANASTLYNDWEADLRGLGIFAESPNIERLLDVVPSFFDQLSEPELLTEDAVKYIDELIRTSKASIELSHPQELVEEKSIKHFKINEHWQMMILTIVIAAIQMYMAHHYSVQSSVSNNQLIDALNQLEDTIHGFPNEKFVSEQGSAAHVIIREAPLRQNPNGKATQLSKLYPNQEVQVIKRVKEWAYVSFYDNLEGIPKMGWVSIRHVRQVR